MSLQAKRLPPYGKPGFFRSIKTSSRIREMNPLCFLLKKFKNHILAVLAFSCPINSWRVCFQKWRGVSIGKDVFIGLHCVIEWAYPEYIILEDNVMLAGGNHLLAHSRCPEYLEGKLLSYVAPIHIKQNSWLGINSIVLPNVTIGEGAVVAAGSVISADVPHNVVIRGNPAEIVKRFA